MTQRKYRERQRSPWGESFPSPVSEELGCWGWEVRGSLPSTLLLTLTPPLASGPPTLAVQAKCDPCLSSPCQNQGTCHNDPLEVYRCACPTGYKVSGG